ncbi:DEAD/DEAH box helicase [Erythrobacter sp. HL-111]|uniref:DEAD/DEAH box helicase n=1 Tax=Erythrobacter sp. HL-111 TaxID=1798193 RepID=UPI0006D9EA00|nr:DEAD/DEAH box helicase [Erythrobacter sp. HL-111]KPP87586.1 MAG: ATP-dependent RNA helicase DeaD [Erythrobacteraceae bacterium HL-111]SDR80465.1 ATP-dependent RNA helicase DeaD [Erythrobacter sp. HL-111]
MNFPPLPASLAAALAERGYTSATPVQAEVMEARAAGRDLVVSAQTGSGKTIAFGLAIAAQLLGEGEAMPAAPSPLALVIAPTRELALQVSRELGWLYAGAGGRIATCVGGMNPQQERARLRAGANIVVGTPGRLRDHLERGALDLAALRAVVLDEADEMLDMGFREELEAILDATPEGRRTLLFSATMPRPIEALARRYQRDALRIATIGEGRGHGDISYEAVIVPPHEVENAVVNLLRFHEAETAILFCATREKVRHLHAVLQERGFAAVALSGEHSQSERNHALQALRDRRARVCVATDVAARGIDLPTLGLVIHVEIPRDAETLQHRSGRTGRAGRKGVAVLIVPFSRRKRVESMLRHARIAAEWRAVPGRDAIRAKDRARLLEKLLSPVEIEEAERDIARQLLAERSPEDIAAMLVRAHSARLPEPGEIAASGPEARREAKKDGPRPGFEDVVWFRLEVGRRDNAEPRWILPLLCRRGDISRNEIGAIRIGDTETFFQVPRAISARFAETAARTGRNGGEEAAIAIERSEAGPTMPPRENRFPGRGFVKARPKGRNPAGRKPKPTGKEKQPHKNGRPAEARRKQRQGR